MKGWVFPGIAGQPLSIRGARSPISKLAEKVGISGVSLREVAEISGHRPRGGRLRPKLVGRPHPKRRLTRMWEGGCGARSSGARGAYAYLPHDWPGLELPLHWANLFPALTTLPRSTPR